MLNNFASTQGGGTDTVTTTMILDGTIANADVASDAAIDVSKISLDDAVVFNESGADKDFRVESDGKTHMLFVDGGNNRVGIGTNAPSQTFEVFDNTADGTITKFSGADGNMSYVGGARLEFSRDGGCYIAAPGGASASMIFQAGDGLHTRMKLANDGRVIIGDGGAEDTAVVFDGNAQDYYVGLDDSADDLVIGLGSAVGTTPAISINEDQDVTISDGAIDFDVASHDGTNGLKLGGTLVTASATELNLIDGYTGTTAELNYLDVTTLGTSEDSKALTQASSVVTVGATDGDQILNIASHDLVDGGLKLAGTLVTSSATELNLLDGRTIVGDCYGPGSSTDMAIARFDGAGGKTLQMSNMTISDDPPVVKIGDGAAEDTMLTFDGNAADFRIGLDDGNDTLEIGAGTTHGTTTAISVDSAADMTLGGYVNFADEQAIRPEIKDYSESYTESSGTGTVTLDMTDGNVFEHTANGGNVTFAFSNPPADDKAGSITLKWIQDSSDRTITWPGSVDWAGGSAPSVTSGSGKVDLYTFLTVDNGTTWYGFQAGADLS